MAGVIVLALMILAILLAPLYMSYDEMISQDVFNKLQPPSAQHPLGTDELGRDLLARVLYGGRISLLGGMATIAIAFTAGCIIGGAAGYFGGKVDTVLMRIIDMLMAIPPVLLAMAILTALGNGLLFIGPILYKRISISATWSIFVIVCAISMFAMLAMVKWLERVTK